MSKKTGFTAGIILLFIVSGTAYAAPPPPSPGIAIGQSSYDFQSSGAIGHQVARLPGEDVVHFAWMHWDRLPLAGIDDNERFVHYLSLSLSSWIEDFGIDLGTAANRLGYPNVAVGSGNSAHVVYHGRESWSSPYEPKRALFPTPGFDLFVEDNLGQGGPSCAETQWPRIAVSQNSPGSDVVHIIGLDNVNDCSPSYLWYWRHDGAIWQGPALIDSVDQISYLITEDPSSGKCAIVFTALEPGMNGLNNIVYYESSSEGQGWITGSELGSVNRQVITSYSNQSGPQAWPDFAAEYDNSGGLHLIWVEQDTANAARQCALKHWTDLTGSIREITRANWPLPRQTPVFSLGLTGVSLGVGDGTTSCDGGSESNYDYLYATYTQLAGPTAAEQADHSLEGYYNGELYLVASRDGGASWSEPVNLSNTKTPNCNPGASDTVTGIPQRPDSVCRSEMWASIGRYVSDIDVFFISDLDAGGIVQGEGTWQLNPVHYLRIPGGTIDAPHICQDFQPAMTISGSGSESVCGSHSLDGTKPDSSILTITNDGNTSLTCSLYTLYQTPPVAPTQWLRLNDTAQTMVFSVPGGGAQTDVLLVADPDGMSPGIYDADLYLAHNAPGHPNPRKVGHIFSVKPCACHADPFCDGTINIQDVVDVIGIAFRGTPPLANENCPALDEDVDCSGSIDVVDVVHVIAVAFRGQAEASEFCRPCDAP